MKRSKFYIIGSWLLLFFFIAGQVSVFAHQHHTNTPVNKTQNHAPLQILVEKCQLCDAMHVNSMLLQQQHYFSPLIVCAYHYHNTSYSFISISLVLASGRAPPLS